THRVRGVEHAHDWPKHGDGFSRRKFSALAQFNVERVALDVFHHEIDRAVGRRAQIVNRDCVRMTKAARSLTFTLKATQPFSVAAHFRRQNFDGNAITEQDVTRTIDGAHSAFTQQGFDLILTVKRLADKRTRIFFEYLAIRRAEAHAVVEFFVADRAVLHR